MLDSHSVVGPFLQSSCPDIGRSCWKCRPQSSCGLTNCYALNTAGQFGNGYQADLTLDHCLIQRAITAGEYVGGMIVVNHSALLEFPADDGVFNAKIADADYDGIYFTEGTHLLMNSLFGFAKDDAIDSGSGGKGTVVVTNCWIEAALHEGLAWSGKERQTWTYDTVILNCGQGLECGWSDGNNSPLCFATRLLSLGNSIGARFGDNYNWSYNGDLTITDSLILNNYRDIFGRSWNDWEYHTNQMEIQDNLITQSTPQHPKNTLWNPARDGEKLAHWMTTPLQAPVGIGIAMWNNLVHGTNLITGIPVGLSSFTIQNVTVEYALLANTTPLAEGTLTFVPGETIRSIAFTNLNLASFDTAQFVLKNPVHSEITGLASLTITNPLTTLSILTENRQLPLTSLTNGVPLHLDGPAPYPISVDFQIEAENGLLTNGSLSFAAGETDQQILTSSLNLDAHHFLRVVLSHPIGAKLETVPVVYYIRSEIPQEPTITTLIDRGSLWHYRELITAPETNWNQLDYIDTHWSSGLAQLGFGENDQATTLTNRQQITTYFRQNFTVANPAEYGQLNGWLLRDDGAVVYLNGTEMFRSANMPSGRIDYLTEALDPAVENATDFFTLSATNLQTGRNLLAVEVHQVDASSSDLSFDFELLGVHPTPPIPPPTLYWGRFSTENYLGWGQPEFLLESADSIMGPGQTISSSSPYPITMTSGQVYFRLRKP